MKQDISQEKKGVDFGGYDSIVIKKHITDIEGGRTLDMTGYPEDVLYAAHVIISQTTNGDKVYKPMPVVKVSGYTYTAVPVDDMYTAVEDPTGQNPYSKGWYTKSGNTYTKCASTETTPQEGTTYYEAKSPATEGWYKQSGSSYVAASETEPASSTTYYVRSGEEYAKDEDGEFIYAYDSLPAGAVYEGVLYRSILKSKPAASILIDGVVNDEVMKIKLGSIASAFKTACPHIIFNHDEEA